MALGEYKALLRRRSELSQAIQEIDRQIRYIQRRLSQSGNGRRQQNTSLERVGLSTQINQLRTRRARLSVQLRQVKHNLRAYDPG